MVRMARYTDLDGWTIVRSDLNDLAYCDHDSPFRGLKMQKQQIQSLLSLPRRWLLATAAVAMGMGLTFSRRGEARSIEPTAVTEHMMYSTVRLVGTVNGGVNLGTGFFYSFPFGKDQFLPVLITNKHVIQGNTHVDFIVHTNAGAGSRPDGKTAIRTVPSDWVDHPNAKVDLCAVAIGSALDQTKAFYRSLDPTIVPSESQLAELSAVEDILMVGYPHGLWDEVNNYPLIRRGITASHPAIDFMVDGVATIVIDAACFPGSSGSPVILHNAANYPNKKGGTVIGSRTMLLGVLFSGPVYEASGKIVIKNIPTKEVPIPVTPTMMNLGYIVKSKELGALKAPILVKAGLVEPK